MLMPLTETIMRIWNGVVWSWAANSSLEATAFQRPLSLKTSGSGPLIPILPVSTFWEWWEFTLDSNWGETQTALETLSPWKCLHFQSHWVGWWWSSLQWGSIWESLPGSGLCTGTIVVILTSEEPKASECMSSGSCSSSGSSFCLRWHCNWCKYLGSFASALLETRGTVTF